VVSIFSGILFQLGRLRRKPVRSEPGPLIRHPLRILQVEIVGADSQTQTAELRIDRCFRTMRPVRSMMTAEL
jgi:hypothetical protein